jgi:FtsH-binding integral membrane protein
MFAWAIGMIVSIYDVWVVLEAFAITTVVVIALTLYVMISKANFNWLGAGLGISLLVC